jgi:tRNA-dihydrouridine synthase B
MIGRAMLVRPWIFGEILDDACAPTNIGRVASRHLDLMIEYYGARTAVPMFRKHLAWYSAGRPNSAEFRIKINGMTDADEIRNEILQFWGCA